MSFLEIIYHDITLYLARVVIAFLKGDLDCVAQEVQKALTGVPKAYEGDKCSSPTTFRFQIIGGPWEPHDCQL